MEKQSSSELETLRHANRDLRHSFDQLSVLQELSGKISTSKTLGDITESITEVIPQVIDCNSCIVYEFDEEKFRKTGESHYGGQAFIEEVDEEMIYWSCKRGTVSVHPGTAEDTGSAIVPLIQGEVLIGAVVIDLGKSYTAYSKVTELSLGSIAGHAALALSNYRVHKELEEKALILKDVKEYNSSVLASITHPLVSVDSDGVVKVFNRKAEEFFEIRSRIVQSNPYAVVFPDFLTAVMDRLLEQIQAGGVPDPCEISFKTNFGAFRSGLISAAPLNLSRTQKKGMVCICQDQALDREVARLRERLKEKDNLIAGLQARLLKGGK